MSVKHLGSVITYLRIVITFIPSPASFFPPFEGNKTIKKQVLLPRNYKAQRLEDFSVTEKSLPLTEKSLPVKALPLTVPKYRDAIYYKEHQQGLSYTF